MCLTGDPSPIPTVSRFRIAHWDSFAGFAKIRDGVPDTFTTSPLVLISCALYSSLHRPTSWRSLEQYPPEILGNSPADPPTRSQPGISQPWGPAASVVQPHVAGLHTYSSTLTLLFARRRNTHRMRFGSVLQALQLVSSTVSQLTAQGTLKL
ncbi:hypothetical protein JAAARDRAFT_198231 [Jaapia argillacea MUCL 33604]|uniref:Uncharacterized protein n=1 Tax=Jaapia argillacea MUCL 33604 TaxID=933084 RepID=A0A067PFJ4_9AGAM|nr:hypothetical protein JAAARDRAFT_198231 [Jaapia argillacea MUCL 33604]